MALASDRNRPTLLTMCGRCRAVKRIEVIKAYRAMMRELLDCSLAVADNDAINRNAAPE